MTGFDFECLKLDILNNGQREPIILHDGMILDGGNRYLACTQLGITPNTINYFGDNITAFVLSVNLHRRHLTPGQQAAIVASVQDWGKAQKSGGTGANQHKKEQEVTNNPLLDTTKSRADLSGVSKSTQKKADAVAKADPKLAAQVARGEVSLNDATREVAPQLAPKKKVQQPENPTIKESLTVEESYQQADEEPNEQVMLIDALESTVEFLTAENERLSDKNLALGSPEEVQGMITKTFESLRAENKLLKINLDAVTRSRDQLMNENSSLKKQVKIEQSRVKKLMDAGKK